MVNIPTELLRTFIKTVDLGSFTRAADAVGRSQSAISLQVQRLESILDAKLFIRTPYHLTLTEPGARLVGYARTILSVNDEAIRSMRNYDIAGSIRLGAPHEYNASLLPLVLGKFAKVHPKVALEVTCDLSRNLIERQRAGEFDIVVALHDDPDETGGIRVVRERLAWIANGEKHHQHWNALPLVIAPPPCIYRRRVLETLHQLNRPWRVAYASSSYTGITAAVRAGIGVSVLAESTIPEGVHRLDESDGFPDLGELDVRVHLRKDLDCDAVQCLADYVAENFVD